MRNAKAAGQVVGAPLDWEGAAVQILALLILAPLTGWTAAALVECWAIAFGLMGADVSRVYDASAYLPFVRAVYYAVPFAYFPAFALCHWWRRNSVALRYLLLAGAVASIFPAAILALSDKGDLLNAANNVHHIWRVADSEVLLYASLFAPASIILSVGSWGASRLTEDRPDRSIAVPSFVLRSVSVVVIAVCLVYFGLAVVLTFDPTTSSPTAGVYAIGCGIQALCQYIAVYRRQRWAALIAALLPLAVGGASIVANHGKWIDAFRIMHPAVFASLFPQMISLVAIVGFSVLMFRWRAQLNPSREHEVSRAGITATRAMRSHHADRLAIGCYSAAGLILFASFFWTPMNSGVPAAFGSIVQPAIWFLACLGVVMGAVVTLALGRGGLLGSRGALVGAIVVLGGAIAQAAFALLGPDV